MYCTVNAYNYPPYLCKKYPCSYVLYYLAPNQRFQRKVLFVCVTNTRDALLLATYALVANSDSPTTFLLLR